MGRYLLDMTKYAALGREVSAESAVLLKNDEGALPVKNGEKVSVFGRIQFDYYKSGTGSGGMVNTEYVISILDALKADKSVILDQELLNTYESWIIENPYDKGQGWGQEPWSQPEMPLSDELVAAAARRSDIALVIIGRTAGEDQDSKAERGSYLLSELEEEMIQKVCKYFKRTAVVLNTGNIIDMKWVEKYNPKSVVYLWQGGMEGGYAAVDVLTGKVNPSGKLPDTIAMDITDYPSTDNFGGEAEAIYTEDIYVGYRYFETAAKDKVLYPFGFGLSYTEFESCATNFKVENEKILLSVTVKNTGKLAGKEVIQVYFSAPQGKLGKPARCLAAYKKTGLLQPGETEQLDFTLDLKDMASYDDNGCTGNKSCYVLEPGQYGIYAGNDVRSAILTGSFELNKLMVTEKLQEVLAPVKGFKRLKAVETAEGIKMMEEAVQTRTIDLDQRILTSRPAEIPYKGDCGITLEAVYDGKASMEDFLSQLSDEDMACIVRGEGMCSPKVTPGTASAFGGVTGSLNKFGIPVGCCADGPSGIRMDCGTRAVSLPNGTAIASTFNEALVEELYEMVGLELRKNRIDTLLGPGMNIHRNPLNGRNFEYFSEDPYLTGKMAAAQLRGMHRNGTTGTIKHFAANNQEFRRTCLDSIASERALREIYLRGYEIAVKEGNAFLVMSTYGAVNGLWTAGNYDLLTTVLRKEWGFEGVVMTDWWAKINDEGEEARQNNTAAMVRAQNDVYMVVNDSEANSAGDNTIDGLKAGTITRGELQRSARNICQVLMKLPVMERFLGRLSSEELADIERQEAGGDANFDLHYTFIEKETCLDISGINTNRSSEVLFGLEFDKNNAFYSISMKLSSDSGEVAQLPLSIFINRELVNMVTINGTNGQWLERSFEVGPFFSKFNYIKLYFGQSGLKLGELKLTYLRDA